MVSHFKKKARNRQHTAETEADYTYDLELIPNTPT